MPPSAAAVAAAKAAQAAKQKSSKSASATKSSNGKEKTIEGYSLSHLLGVAEKVVTQKTAKSVVLDRQAEAGIPKFQPQELTLGRVLGRGGFCVVNEITNIRLVDTQKAPAKKKGSDRMDNDSSGHSSSRHNDEQVISNIVQDRSFMEHYCIRSGKDCRYAIKRVQDSCREKDAQMYINAVVDLAIEARFLSVVRHSNIIKMRAMNSCSPYDDTFFVVLDRLYDILSVRLTKWKKMQPAKNALLKRVLDRGGKKELAFYLERITVAYDLACALKYLHDLHILYRDLKPDNIGFDVRGDVKIFDFGLAKEYDPDSVNPTDGTYNLTGDTGSPRYMAPEVALSKPYNASCDVYSFSILMWQILALETPFDGYSMSMFKKKVIVAGTRPKPDPRWPEVVSNMLRSGWDAKFQKRPDMEYVCDVLRDEINSKADESINEIMDASRKSAMSLHG